MIGPICSSITWKDRPSIAVLFDNPNKSNILAASVHFHHA